MSEDMSSKEKKVVTYSRKGIVALGAAYLGVKAAEKIVGAQSGVPVPPLEPGKTRRILPGVTGGTNSSLNEPPLAQPPTPTPENGQIQHFNSLKEMATISTLTYSNQKESGGKIRKFEIRRSSKWNKSATIKSEFAQGVIDNLSQDLAAQGADRIIIVMLKDIEETAPEIVPPPAWPRDWTEFSYDRNGVDKSYGSFSIKSTDLDGEKVVVVGYAQPTDGSFFNEDAFKNKVTGTLGRYLAKGAVLGRDVSGEPNEEARVNQTYPLYQQSLQTTSA